MLLFLVLLEIIGVSYIYGKHDNLRFWHIKVTDGVKFQDVYIRLTFHRREPFYQRPRDDAWKEDLHFLALVEIVLVRHQPLHHSGEHDLTVFLSILTLTQVCCAKRI